MLSLSFFAAPLLCLVAAPLLLSLPQMDALRRGVDVVVGTPGRVMDLLDRKRLIGDKVCAACVCVCVVVEGGARTDSSQQPKQQLTKQEHVAQTGGWPDWQTAQAVARSVWLHCLHCSHYCSPAWLCPGCCCWVARVLTHGVSLGGNRRD